MEPTFFGPSYEKSALRLVKRSCLVSSRRPWREPIRRSILRVRPDACTLLIDTFYYLCHCKLSWLLFSHLFVSWVTNLTGSPSPRRVLSSSALSLSQVQPRCDVARFSCSFRITLHPSLCLSSSMVASSRIPYIYKYRARQTRARD